MAHKAIRKERVRKPRLAASNECGKVAYHDRKQARQGARTRVPGEHLRPYRCLDCGLWHVGHIPYAVRRGVVSADEWYGNRAAA